MTEASPPRRPSAWRRLGTGWRLAIAAVAALVAFAAIGLGTAASSSAGGARHPGLAHVEATIVTILLGWTILMTIVIAVWALTAKGGPPIPRPGRGPLTRAQQLALLLAAVALAFVVNALMNRPDKPSHLPRLPQVAAPKPGRAPKPGHGLVDARVVTTGVIVAVVLTLLAIAAVYWWDRKHRPKIEPLDVRDEEDDLAVLARAIDDALADLAAEPDPRRAVIMAYARMERALREQGVARRSWETPTEYLDRVLRQLGARAASVDRLTELFQQAKFSHHPVDDAMKRAAIEALEQVRAGLAVPA